MNHLTNFTVLIERRALKYLAKLTTVVVMILSLLTGQLAIAAPGSGQGQGAAKKVSSDLQDAIDAGATPSKRWAKEHRGQRMVQVVFVSGDADQDMTELRKEIKRAGGTVDATMPGLRMLTATLPARRVAKVAERSDVRFVAPNRETRRTASTLEAITGATTNGVRTNSTKTSYRGLDGTGIGIAVVDSGVMRSHKAFQNAAGTTRVVKNVQFMTTALADWTNGYDASTSLQPGSAALAAYEAAIDNSTNLVQDGFGHGTHVASVAAGRPATYSFAPDLTGMAPNASIYDVKVLNDRGWAPSATRSKASSGSSTTPRNTTSAS